jgi:hypothetical protein
MNRIIKSDELVSSIMAALDNAVAEFPEDEREEAKARILQAWQPAMFYGKGHTKLQENNNG